MAIPAINPFWPLMYFGVAFNAGANDTSTALNWSDLTPRLLSWDGSFGRQYETDTNAALEVDMVLDDPDEDLNPGNPSSPFAPNVLSYRAYVRQAMWPPVPVGAAVNMMNANTVPTAMDPSFESYAVGSAVPWIGAVGSAAGVVSNGSPHSGTKCFAYTIPASASTPQGIFWNCATIPGQQYTASGYLEQSVANSQTMSVIGQTALLDQFQRTVAGGLGTPTIGPAYTIPAGAADYSVNGTQGIIAPSVPLTDRFAVASVGSTEQNWVATMGPLPIPASNVTRQGVVARWVDASNHYRAYAEMNAGGVTTAVLAIENAGTQTTLASQVTDLVPGATLMCRLRARGAELEMVLWDATMAESTGTVLVVTNSTFSGTSGGIWCLHTTAANVPFFFDSLQSVCTIAGSTTVVTGGYVRLTLTFTASQPFHAIEIATTGANAAATVFVDDLQFEVGPTASAFSPAIGPVIYTVSRGWIERWPSTWTYNGIRGQCAAVGVDAFAFLAQLPMTAEYPASVLAKSPDYYWRLNDGSGATQFADISGNHGPPLLYNVGKEAPATTAVAGNSVAIPGDPSATGVQFAGSTPVLFGGHGDGTGLQVGLTRPTGTPAIACGGTGATWTETLAWWHQYPATWPTAPGPGITLCGSGGLNTATGPSINTLCPTASSPHWSIDASYRGVQLSTTAAGSQLADGKPHLMYLTAQLAAGVLQVFLYQDGLAVASMGINTATSWGTATPSFVLGALQLNGAFDSTYQNGGPDGTYAHLSIWHRALSAGELNDLHSAGASAYAGERSSTRVARWLNLPGGYSGLKNIMTGSSIMGPSTVNDGDMMLDSIQGVTTSENGDFWMDQNGILIFAGRTARYLATTPKWVFGEHEAPYEDGIEFDFDPSQLANFVTITRTGGAVIVVTDAASIKANFPRQLDREIQVSSDLEATDAANWLLATRKQPRQRISGMQLKPSANPALWPVILGVSKGDRITAFRRTSAGFVMQLDFYIEQIGHADSGGSWIASYEASPALGTTPWILGDPVYGVLGFTTIPGY